MKFNSQICTTREQSERLLSLGLKNETADMCRYKDSDGYWATGLEEEVEQDIIEYYDLAIIQNEFVRLIDDIGDIYIYFDRDGIYESLLLCIEWLIKEGHFNKEYLV